jgi:hypothetical protein
MGADGDARVLRDVVGLEANATLVRHAVEASSGVRAVGPSITHAQVRPDVSDLDAPDGRGLVAAVDVWEETAGRALVGHPWLRPASLRPIAAALHALARAGHTEVLDVATLWRLATLPVEEPEWIVEIAGSLVQPQRRLPPASRRGPEEWSLEEAERVASRARGFAALANAFPGVGGLDRDQLLGLEQTAADRITGVLGREVTRASFGRCRNCARTCPPWTDICDRCQGRTPAAVHRRRPGGGRPPTGRRPGGRRR